ncbi:MAG TPA: methyltransferase domain-containing protein [Bryobacteraceae bacterium]|nr:methyltransferase domain-containing protein [Bryobacteraceae bacterium]
MAHVRAGDAASTARTRELLKDLTELGWYHSIELPDGTVIPGLHSSDQLRARLARFGLPEDLRGKRVLDIGAWDGWFSFEMERRGARVVAVDVVERSTFRRAHELLGSRVEFVLSDVFQLSPERIGRFDIVLFLGVLYHVKHPLLALERVCALTTDVACVQSFVSDDGDLAASPNMEFYETNELVGRMDNWVGPNTSCLLAFCRTAGFAQVEFAGIEHHHAHVVCRRHWPEEPENPAEPAPVVTGAVNHRTGEGILETAFDDYVAVFFKADPGDLRLNEVLPEIGGYGVQPVYLGHGGAGGWQLNCGLPPGIGRGRAMLRVRTSRSRFSNAVPILIDPTPEDTVAIAEAAALEVTIIADGRDWARNQVRLGRDGCLSLWVRGIPEVAARRRVGVIAGDRELEVVFLSAADEAGVRQVNALVPADIEPGWYELVVRYGNVSSPPARIRAVAE